MLLSFVTRCCHRFSFSQNFDVYCNHYLTLILLILISNPVTLSHTLSYTYIN